MAVWGGRTSLKNSGNDDSYLNSELAMPAKACGSGLAQQYGPASEDPLRELNGTMVEQPAKAPAIKSAIFTTRIPVAQSAM